MRMSNSEYRPIPMSARQILQSYALLKTTDLDACCMVNLNGLWLVPKDAVITVLTASLPLRQLNFDPQFAHC